MNLNGLHHVTAVTSKAQQNLNFYTDLLGMRLVKKTVNQDDVSAYHLFYADKLGSPGTDLTFFDWAQMAQNVIGSGSIVRTYLRVPSRAALDWWANYLTEREIDHSGIVAFHQHDLIYLSDPEGQLLALVNDEGAPGGEPWDQGPVPVEFAITGLYASELITRDAGPTAFILTEVMGYRQTAEYPDDDEGQTIVFETGEGGAGREIYLVEQPDAVNGHLGYGGVHHIAFRVANDEEQQQWRRRLVGYGLPVSEFIDRFYFHSIYFRIPGGFLFEIATDGPGFAADEDPAHLGESLALPPFLEPQRARIEAGLKPLH